MPSTKKTIVAANVQRLATSFSVIGTTPMIMHRFAAKAWQQLLLPSAKKNKAEREQTLKQDPLLEFREAIYRHRDPKTPTLCCVPSGMLARAIQDVALDMAGAKKSEVGRHTRVQGANLDFYGVPTLGMHMVRSSGMNRTPAVRTRPIFQEWCIPEIVVEYKPTPLTGEMLGEFLHAAGDIVGIGDWRPQKGGDFGRFRVVANDDPELLRIMAEGGRDAQEEAFESPDAFDEDAAELFAWFNREVLIREQEAQATTAAKKPRRKLETAA